MEDIVLDINWLNIPKTKFDPNEAFLHLLEVYIDDFIKLIQSTIHQHWSHQKAHKKSFKHNIRYISTSLGHRQQNGTPISVKKRITEGMWEIWKEILGWLLDGIALTIELPTNKCNSILVELRAVRQLKCVSITCLRKLQGMLQFVSIALSIGKPLLGPIEIFMTKANNTKRKTVFLSDDMKHQLRDWSALLHLTCRRPTHVQELFTHKPRYQGLLVDASMVLRQTKPTPFCMVPRMA